MTGEKPIEHRRAIEALRSGVPSRDAVLALGCDQPAIEQKFRDQLEAARAGAIDGNQATGLLIAGDFGSGKSHLLEYLQHTALDENFVCSKVVISKETPLHDPVKLYRSAVESAMVPHKRGSALTEIATGLDPASAPCIELDTWVHSESQLNARFAATFYLFKSMPNDMGLRNRIISFWSGDPLGAGEVKRCLSAIGERATYKIEKVNIRELALQRFQFTPRLITAAGYSGWVLLVDEIELVGRYSPSQRGKSYAELARWSGKHSGQQFPGLTTVFAIMSNFESEILEEKDDLEAIPRKLTDKGFDELAKQAKRGMQFIRKEKVPLKPPGRNAIVQSRDKVRAIYAQAYGWSPPQEQDPTVESSTAMRQHVKRWINEWDLKRLYPDYQAETEVTELRMDYSEDADLQTPSAEADGFDASSLE